MGGSEELRGPSGPGLWWYGEEPVTVVKGTRCHAEVTLRVERKGFTHSVLAGFLPERGWTRRDPIIPYTEQSFG